MVDAYSTPTAAASVLGATAPNFGRDSRPTRRRSFRGTTSSNGATSFGSSSSGRDDPVLSVSVAAPDGYPAQTFLDSVVEFVVDGKQVVPTNSAANSARTGSNTTKDGELRCRMTWSSASNPPPEMDGSGATSKYRPPPEEEADCSSDHGPLPEFLVFDFDRTLASIHVYHTLRAEQSAKSEQDQLSYGACSLNLPEKRHYEERNCTRGVTGEEFCSAHQRTNERSRGQLRVPFPFTEFLPGRTDRIGPCCGPRFCRSRQGEKERRQRRPERKVWCAGCSAGKNADGGWWNF